MALTWIGEIRELLREKTGKRIVEFTFVNNGEEITKSFDNPEAAVKFFDKLAIKGIYPLIEWKNRN